MEKDTHRKRDSKIMRQQNKKRYENQKNLESTGTTALSKITKVSKENPVNVGHFLIPFVESLNIPVLTGLALIGTKVFEIRDLANSELKSVGDASGVTAPELKAVDVTNILTGEFSNQTKQICVIGKTIRRSTNRYLFHDPDKISVSTVDLGSKSELNTLKKEALIKVCQKENFDYKGKTKAKLINTIIEENEARYIQFNQTESIEQVSEVETDILQPS